MRKRKTFIIAEAGVNHNGSYKRALQMIDVAKKAGVDAIKFQTFNASELLIKNAPLANYQKKNKIKNQFQLIKKLELTKKEQKNIKKYCDRKKIIFLSSAFDINSLKFLKNLNLKIFKIPSGEINNIPYLKEVGSYKKKIFLSTGASELNEITLAIKILVDAGTPKKNITVLHCNSEYPTPIEDANLNVVKYLRSKLKLKIGYSDHTLGLNAAIASVALGAEVIEKHFTLNKKLKGPDHKASITTDELFHLVKNIRNLEKALGKERKVITKSEKKNQKIIRKSIVASVKIFKNQIFTSKNITCKRPGTGISPKNWNKIIGKKSKFNFERDDQIKI